ncbi:fibronectin type III domain-containing protein [bacterium]|nr:fibronectin type III domain-containing protein [bacterium]
MGKITRLIALCVFVCAMFGCAGQSANVEDITTLPDTLNAARNDGGGGGLLDLPAPLDLKTPAYLESDLYIYGDEYITDYPYNLVNESEQRLVFDPRWSTDSPQLSDMSYAMYEYALGNYDREQEIHFFWNTTANYEDAWLGFANWSTNSWDWMPLPTDDMYDGDFSNYVYYPGGRVIVALVFVGASDWDLSYMRFGNLVETLAAPTDVQASDGMSYEYVQITWSRVMGATGYQIYRDNQTYLIETVGDVTYYDDTDVEELTDYTYWVKAINNIAQSGLSLSDTGWALEAPPDPPANLQASDGLFYGAIMITWDAVPDADTYTLYQDNKAKELVTGLTGCSFLDTSAVGSSGNTVTYWVRAISGLGPSDYSESDTGYAAEDTGLPPDPPTNLSATDSEYYDKVVLTWDTVPFATEYWIYRDNTGLPIAQTGEITDTYEDTTVTDANVHTYWVKGRNHNGPSELSNSDEGSRKALTPPSNFQATDLEYNDKTVLTWTKSPDATGYKIYLDLQANLRATVGDVDSWDDTTIDTALHNYYIEATLDTLTSEKIGPEPGQRAPNIPDPPADVSATDGTYNDRIRLTWTPSAGATGYDIYRDITGIVYESVNNVDTWDDEFVPDHGSENTHEYWIKAKNDDGISGLSASDTGWREANPPDAPTDVAASDGDFNDRIRLTWTPSAGATGYEIYRDDTGAGVYKTVGDVATWDDLFFVPDYTVHTYWLKAVNDDGSSPTFSASDTGYAEE